MVLIRIYFGYMGVIEDYEKVGRVGLIGRV